MALEVRSGALVSALAAILVFGVPAAAAQPAVGAVPSLNAAAPAWDMFDHSRFDPVRLNADWGCRGWRCGRGWRGGWGGGWRDNGIDGGDVLIGAAILGGAIAIASSNSRRRARERDRDVVIIERDQRNWDRTIDPRLDDRRFDVPQIDNRRFDNRSFDGPQSDDRRFDDRRFDGPRSDDRRFDDPRFEDRSFDQRGGEDRRFGDPRGDDRRFEGPRSGGRGGDVSGLDSAVDQCLARIERDVRVGGVDDVSRTGSGWAVSGTLFNGSPFRCRIGNDGRIEDIDYRGGFSAAPMGVGAPRGDGQWSDQRYADARLAMGGEGGPNTQIEVYEAQDPAAAQALGRPGNRRGW